MNLPEELMAIARKELNEDETTREQYVATLRDWLSKQPHLRVELDDNFLVTFLRGTKFSTERAKQKLDAYFTYRTHLPEVFGNRDPFSRDIQTAIDLRVVAAVKPKTPGERWLMVRKIRTEEVSRITPESVMKIVMMMLDLLIYEQPEIGVLGADLVLCLENFGASHIMVYTPPVIKKIVKLVQDCNPIRVHSIIIVNSSKLVESVVELFKSFASEKIRNRVIVYGKGSSTPQLDLIRDSLPEEFGGTNGKFEDHTAYVRSKLESYKDWFAEQEKYKCIEELRPGKPKTYSDLFGMEGSFRKLCVD